MNHLRISFFLIIATFSSFAADELSEARGRLEEQVSLIEKIEPYTERPDLARLLFLKGSAKQVLASMASVGLGHKSTFQEFQKHIVAFRFSVAFLRDIETEKTRGYLAKLQSINEEIAKAHGFDDSPYTQITLSVFLQMEKLEKQLSELPLDQDFKLRLVALRPILGNVIAKARAKGGDRRTLYPFAEEVYNTVVKMYPDFNKIAFSDRAFNITLEIQGLNEFYGEFAEFGKKQ